MNHVHHPEVAFQVMRDRQFTRRREAGTTRPRRERPHRERQHRHRAR